MVRGFGAYAVAILLGVVALVGAWPSIAGAQVGQQNIPEIKAEQKDIREVLRDLFKQVGTSYSISPDVQGSVTIQLRNVTFEMALANVVRQVDATYRIEGGVYQIIKRGLHVVGGPQDLRYVVGEPADQSAPVMTMDDRHLYVLKGETLYKVSKSDLKTVAQGVLGR